MHADIWETEHTTAKWQIQGGYYIVMMSWVCKCKQENSHLIKRN